MPLGESLRRTGIVRQAWRFRVAVRRRLRDVGLSNLFLAAAFVVVAIAMVGLGNWAGGYLNASISQGVAETAASSIDSLIANNLRGLGKARPVDAETRATLDDVFTVSNDVTSTRLLQIRIRDIDGRPIYESFGGIISPELPGAFEAAREGKTVSRVSDLPLQAVGPIEAALLPVLQIQAPIHDRRTGKVFAVADLYYSARSVIEIQRRAQLDVWVMVSLTGLAVIAVLYVMVIGVSRTITMQQARLARNLEASRRLADENEALHVASERQRIDAALSNEGLLSSVGSDLHDGPIQLLTLLILRLSKNAADNRDSPALSASLSQTVKLATDAMEEMRSISSGLILPELADATLEDAIHLAIQRHEATIGRVVGRRIISHDTLAPMTVKVCAYRIVQEALNNAYWHGDMRAARVTAEASEGVLQIEISNRMTTAIVDGEASPPSGNNLGMRSMRLRVEALGGRLRFATPSPSKAVISADIPMDGRGHLISSAGVAPLPSASLPD